MQEVLAPPAPLGTSDAATVCTVFWRFFGAAGPCMGAKAKAPASTSPHSTPVVRTRHSLHLLLMRLCAQMLAPEEEVLFIGTQFSNPRSPYIGSFGAGAGRCSPPRTPCICPFGASAGRCPPPALQFACAPFALVADARAPAILALAPDALVLADARPPALLAITPPALVLADSALLAFSPLALVMADAPLCAADPL